MLVMKPPMGFNTWNTFGSDINEKLIMEIADSFCEKGLADAGYEYIIIDDCWSEMERDAKSGDIVPDRVKFPHGMKYLADYIHSKGLKFGMYSCSGVKTCQGYPGSFGHEFHDAKTFASYECDLLKYDYCFRPDTVNPQLLYRRMGAALRGCGRDILFSVCTGGADNPSRWARAVGGSMYRSTGDISDCYESFKGNALSQVSNQCFSAPGCFNDIDMLTVGMRGNGNVGDGGCSDVEYRQQFAIWCMFGAPLILGCDIRNIDSETLGLVTNKELISINQDPECRGCFEVSHHPWESGKVAYFKLLSDGDYALAMFNFGDTDGKVPFYFYNAGFGDVSGVALSFFDVFTGENAGIHQEYFERFVPAHGCEVFRAKPSIM